MGLSFCSLPHNKILALSWVVYMSLKQGLTQAQIHKEASIAILLILILRKVRPRGVKYIAKGEARTGDQLWASSHSVLWIPSLPFSFLHGKANTNQRATLHVDTACGKHHQSSQNMTRSTEPGKFRPKEKTFNIPCTDFVLIS